MSYRRVLNRGRAAVRRQAEAVLVGGLGVVHLLAGNVAQRFETAVERHADEVFLGKRAVRELGALEDELAALRARQWHIPARASGTSRICGSTA